MDVSVLGPLVVTDDGGEVAVNGERLRTLLMLFAAHIGVEVTQSRLIEELWGDDQPKAAPNALQVLVSKLRRVLGSGASALVTTPHGYRLDHAACDVDWVRFEAEVTRGRSLLVDGDPIAAEVLADALSLWRGEPFDGATDGVLGDRSLRLREVRLNALEDRIDADLRLGRHFEVVEELRRLVSEHALRERVHGLLMLALYRCGRQADALRAFAAARAVLLDELGVDPSHELCELEMKILNHDPALSPSVQVESAVQPTGFASNLPWPVGVFVGRAPELEELERVVERSRLVSIVAPGGAGKTRTSVEVARRWADRSDVWFVDLAPLRRDGSVVDAVAATVGCEVGDGRAGSGTLDRLTDHLARRPALLVMDNCEHVVQEAAFVVDRLVRACRDVRVVATTREALRVNGETVWSLQPMSQDDGVALFVECARRVSGLDLDEREVPVVTELCRRLDGSPLAIELAASRVGSMSVEQIVDRLDDRFRLLADGARTAMPRQQTLRAVVEWSYRLLSEEERLVFDRLSVFAGTWSLDAAEAVVAGAGVDAGAVVDLLAQLVAKSLVEVDRSHGVRYRMLHTLRLYGRERLAATGELDRSRRMHAEHFAELCARGQAAFRGVDQLGWLEAVRTDLDNLHEALSWTLGGEDIALGRRMLAGLGPGWLCNGRAQEGWRWLRRGLDADADSPVEVRADLATCASYLGLLTGRDPTIAHDISVQAVSLCRAAIDRPNGVDRLALSLMTAGRRRYFDGDISGARACWVESRELFARSTSGWSQAMEAEMTGRLASLDDDVETAYAALRRAVEVYEASGVWWAVAVLASDVGLSASLLGAHHDAVEHFQRGLRAAALIRLSTATAVLTSQLAATKLVLGDHAAADRLSALAVALADEADTSFARSLTLTNRARVSLGLGRTDEALDAARIALAVADAAGTPWLARAPEAMLVEAAAALNSEDG